MKTAFRPVIILIIALLGSEFSAASGTHAETEMTMSDESPIRVEQATFGGGCFWCLEAVYERIEGVKSVISGYAGGTRADPTYEEVCTGRTGHAEVVRIEYDPALIGYKELLKLFWKAHDPTTLNRQGADVGTQYRSIIFYHSEAQRVAAEKSIQEAEASGRFDSPIVTEIKPLTAFYRAEEYHQDYYAKNLSAGYCTFVIRPKLQKLGLDWQ